MLAVGRRHGSPWERASGRCLDLDVVNISSHQVTRLAQDISLHKIDKDADDEAIPRRSGSLWDLEYKRRLWAKLFSWDRYL